MDKIQNFFFDNEIEKKVVGDGVERKVLAYNKDLMVCHLFFKKGAIGALHHHPHTQCTYILKGKFEFEVDGVKKVVSVGDTLIKQPDVVHGAVCLEEGELLDIFTPMRDEFV